MNPEKESPSVNAVLTTLALIIVIGIIHNGLYTLIALFQ